MTRVCACPPRPARRERPYLTLPYPSHNLPHNREPWWLLLVSPRGTGAAGHTLASSTRPAKVDGRAQSRGGRVAGVGCGITCRGGLAEADGGQSSCCGCGVTASS